MRTRAGENNMPPPSAVLAGGGKILAGCNERARIHCRIILFLLFLFFFSKEVLLL